MRRNLYSLISVFVLLFVPMTVMAQIEEPVETDSAATEADSLAAIPQRWKRK